MPTELPQSKEESQRIASWKEIAAFFGRDERTVKRWEGQRGLPVHRVPGGRGTVYAFTAELTAWLRSSQQRENQDAALALDAEVSPEVFPREVRDMPQPDPLVGWYPISDPPKRPVKTWQAWLVLAAGCCVVALLFLVGPGSGRVRAFLEHVIPAPTERAATAPRKEAEDLYMQGRYYWNKRTPEGLTLALDDFTKATKIDPNYALGYAGQADCYNLLREYTSMPPSQAFPLAIAAANKAVELDDRLPEGHRALGFAYFWWNWDIAGGEREFRRAIALDPKDVEAHHWYATALMSVARYPEAVAQIEEARKLDPASSSIAADRAEIFFSAGRQDEAIEILRNLEKSEPSFLSPYVYLRNAYFDRRDYANSFDQAELMAKLTHDSKALAVVQTSRQRLRDGGENGMLQGQLADQIAEFRQGNTKAVDVAETCALLGKNKETMEYLEKAYERHEYELITMGYWKGFDSIRADPEFQDLLRRIGLNPVQKN